MLAWALTIPVLCLAVAAPFFETSDERKVTADRIIVLAAFMVFLLGFALVGRLVATRRPRNPIGWLMCIAALGFALGGLGLITGKLAADHPGWPVVNYLAVLGNSMWGVGAGAAGLTLLLFPDGHFLSRRWKFVGFAATACFLCLFLGLMIQADPIEIDAGVTVPNPLAVQGPLWKILQSVGDAFFPFILIGGGLSTILRFRRSRGETRLQMKWLGYGAFAVIGALVVAVVLETVFATDNETAVNIANALESGALALLPLAIGIGILKYRLYDIDVVINKTIVFGGLAAFITGIYVAIVVGIGSALGSSDKPNLALSIAATAVVAIAFSPVKERVERVANRLVYGKRVTPYEALAEFTDKVATSYETAEVAPAMAATIAEGTGAAQAHVWLVLGRELVRAAAHPEDERTPPAVPLDGLKDTLPDVPDVDLIVPVVHRGELLGGLSLNRSKGEGPSSADRKLLSDLASQAGIVLRNTRLTAELKARLDQISDQAEEIRRSRQRIVATQDQERRRLERDIHDGAQQHLVALAVKLNLAKTMAQRKPERAEAMLEQLKGEVREALDTLGDLARGIYPPLLAERGLGEAMRARAEKAPFLIEVRDETSGRLDPRVEAAVYFTCLEALQNVAKYANATKAEVSLEAKSDELRFKIADDGDGFDPAAVKTGSGIAGMADRMATVGGRVEITSAPGKGTTLTGTVPIHVLESA